jgi:hypothetical protein
MSEVSDNSPNFSCNKFNYNSLSNISKFYFSVDDFNKIKGLSVIHFNIQSLVNKIDQIRLFCAIYKPDLLCLTESWLTSNHTDFEFNISGYESHRCDREDKRGGGVIVYSILNRNFDLERIILENKSNIEYVTLKLYHKHSHPFYVTTLYCPPNNVEILKSSFFDFFYEILGNECIFVGDTNVDLISKADSKSWKKTFESFNFKQLISQSTRITNSASTLIDHIYTNEHKNISGHGVLPFSISDHQPIYLKRKLNFSLKNKSFSHKTVKFRDWKHIDHKEVHNKLHAIKLNIRDSKDVNEICNEFTEKIHEVISDQLPFTGVRVKQNKFDGWINQQIIDSILTRDKFKRRLINDNKKGLNTDELREQYKYSRNFTTYLIRKRKKEFLCEKIKSCGNDSKKLWRTLSAVISTKTSMKTDSSHEMNYISADQFNEFFTEGPKLIIAKYINEAETDYVQQSLTESIFSIPIITENDASKLINSFSSAKSSGSDGISIRLIKTFKFSLLSILVLIMNLSIKY